MILKVLLALNGGVSVGYVIVSRILKTIASFAIIFFISLYVLKLKTKNAELKQQLEYTEAHLIKQNESIEKLELESQKYKIIQPKEKEKIKEKYRQVVIKDSECNEQLESYESLLNAFKRNIP
ncbi:hypothetical protein [Helicobacter pylori]|uniref:hypothetical protein n=1 Tax=Helicobacter pylori TaxID=210 RepID=UPI001F08DBCE|nr:hypothetical protein [Helicobacter pylori]